MFPLLHLLWEEATFSAACPAGRMQRAPGDHRDLGEPTGLQRYSSSLNSKIRATLVHPGAKAPSGRISEVGMCRLSGEAGSSREGCGHFFFFLSRSYLSSGSLTLQSLLLGTWEPLKGLGFRVLGAHVGAAHGLQTRAGQSVRFTLSETSFPSLRPVTGLSGK